MNINIKFKQKNIFLFFGLLDVLYILINIYTDFVSGLIPYYSGITNSIDVINNYGGWFPIVLFILNIILQLSIGLSAILLLLNHKWSKILCYSQFPFRLFLVVPSVPFILELFSKITQNNVYVTIVILLLFEIIKVVLLIRSK